MNTNKLRLLSRKIMQSAAFRKMTLVIIDLFTVIIAGIFIFLVIPRGTWEDEFMEQAVMKLVLVMIVCVLLARLILRIYNSIWRYAETMDYLKIVVSDYVACCVTILIVRVLIKDSTPIYFIALVYMLELLLTLCTRFFYKYIRSDSIKKPTKDSVYVAIVGAGNACISLIDELQKDKYARYIPYCLFDTDPSKIGMRIHGIKIKGTDNDIPKVLEGTPVKDIILAIPSMPVEKRKELFDICSKAGCRVKIFEYALDRMEKSSSTNLTNQLRDANAEDFLQRKSVNLNMDSVKNLIKDKTILITGGGGSIGSELCRQIASMNPGRLVIVDIYENTAYEIQQELEYIFPGNLNLNIEIMTVRDREKVEFVFEKYKPDIVFHAAAHKHVPLMEDCCDEVVKNNIFGTYNIIEASEKFGVKKMILISTDKAVNPTNIMGASKRFCEMIIQSKKNSSTDFAAVRFGNVLNSNGSVIPLFKKQIEHGGPITLTDKRIIRYFMTIAEAVQLVITASTMASKSEIFVLDMGEPVKIIDLAEQLIRLAGLRPYKDIAIIEKGLRPGEKLYEELLMKTELLFKTKNDKIFIEKEKEISVEEIKDGLLRLETAVEAKDNEIVRTVLMELVPTYKLPCDVNNEFEGKAEVGVEPVEIKGRRKN